MVRLKGVALLNWDHFVSSKWYLLYEKLAYRRLSGFQRTSENMSRLEAFISKSVGKKYKLTASKILRR